MCAKFGTDGAFALQLSAKFGTSGAIVLHHSCNAIADFCNAIAPYVQLHCTFLQSLAA